MDRNVFGARLEALPHPLRIAVGATCLERVLPIVAAISDDAPAAHRAAIALAWRYARSEPIDLAEVQATTIPIDPGELAEEGEVVGSLDRIVQLFDLATLNLARALDGHEKLPGSVVNTAIEQARQVVYNFMRYEDVATDWALLEDDWQESVLALAEQSRDPGALRPAAAPPAWARRLEEAW